MLVIGFGSVILLANADQGRRGGNDAITGFVCLGACFLGLVWLIATLIVQYTGIRPKEITLQGVSEQFIDALEQQDRQGGGRDQRPPPHDRQFDRDDDRYYER